MSRLIEGSTPEEYAALWGSVPDGVCLYNFGSESWERTPENLTRLIGEIDARRSYVDSERYAGDDRDLDAESLGKLRAHVSGLIERKESAPPSNYLTDINCKRIPYADIVAARKGKPFPMSLVGQERQWVIHAANQGIDSHLESCNCPNRGDSYTPSVRLCNGIPHTSTLECSVSPESLLVLLRRLFELADEQDEDTDDRADVLAQDILDIVFDTKDD